MHDLLRLAVRQRPSAYDDAEPARMRAYALRLSEEGEIRLAEILARTADEIEICKAMLLRQPAASEVEGRPAASTPPVT